MIIVSGLQRKTGQVRTQTYLPGQEGAARLFRRHLREKGYNTVLVNDVKEAYRARRAADSVPDGYQMRDAFKKPEVFGYEGVNSYQLHSLGTARGDKKNIHLKDSGTNFLDDAVESAEKQVAKWSDTHKGIVIYKAIKLVRKIVKPTTEVVELTVVS